MGAPSPKDLSRREREVLDIVYRLERASANKVMAEMEEPPSPCWTRTSTGTGTARCRKKRAAARSSMWSRRPRGLSR